MPIFEFTVSQTILVEADDSIHAHQVAKDCITELDWQNYHVEFEQEVLSQEDLNPSEWDVQCIPYGGDGNTRLKDLLPVA
ncbi:MAG: hypothetical protein RBS40_13370 [Rhodocyclaceae bacterium]|jgi:hypothetical protein|nr:hypothetical protein [Rhodocyclaceae bacterium]